MERRVQRGINVEWIYVDNFTVLSSYSTPQVKYITDDDKEKKVLWLLGNDHNFHKGKEEEQEDEVIEFMFCEKFLRRRISTSAIYGLWLTRIS